MNQTDIQEHNKYFFASLVPIVNLQPYSNIFARFIL
jgi:hypothetical protein